MIQDEAALKIQRGIKGKLARNRVNKMKQDEGGGGGQPEDAAQAADGDVDGDLAAGVGKGGGLGVEEVKGPVPSEAGGENEDKKAGAAHHANQDAALGKGAAHEADGGGGKEAGEGEGERKLTNHLVSEEWPKR